MTQALIRQMPITAPVRQSPPGSILDCAQVIETDSLWANFQDGFWTSAGCGSSSILDDPLCGDQAAGYRFQKDFADPVWAHSHTFAVYRALSCNVVGFTLTTSDLENAYDAAEGRAVAKAIWQLYDPLAHPVTAMDMNSAMCSFGALAEYTLDNYGALPIYLLPAQMAVALQADRVLNPGGDGGLHAAVGGCVAIGAGMTTALALGMVVILRTPRVTREVINPATNELFLLTERAYMVGVDCDFAAKVPTTINCGAMP